jgi:hypothetical protein
LSLEALLFTAARNASSTRTTASSSIPDRKRSQNCAAMPAADPWPREAPRNGPPNTLATPLQSLHGAPEPLSEPRKAIRKTRARLDAQRRQCRHVAGNTEAEKSHNLVK